MHDLEMEESENGKNPETRIDVLLVWNVLMSFLFVVVSFVGYLIRWSKVVVWME